MRITGRQLRQIIKEELSRASRINEADLFSYDEFEREEQDEFSRKMAKAQDPFAGVDLTGDETVSGAVAMPSAKNAPAAPAALGPLAARLPAMIQISSELPEYFQEIKSLINNPAVRKKLLDVYSGKNNEILKIGDSGGAVKVYQAVVIANLMMWAKSRRSLVARSEITLDPLAVAQKAIPNGDITDEDLAGAITNLVTMPLSSLVDGRYGPLTRAAVALLQTIMKRKQIISAFADGASVNWDAAIDGKIGRQTGQFLAGFTKLGAVTGVSVNETARRRMNS